ncbi:unnamed protein product [Pleuronectes platessa]|uniref:Uncharacterized protein n=1 Tax=Pleuronectes platessa TaxID=8262 RepID=A0A9N7Y787_PLEPL|nr:unnamed protein product [Pleuronectes platessa]
MHRCPENLLTFSRGGVAGGFTEHEWSPPGNMLGELSWFRFKAELKPELPVFGCQFEIPGQHCKPSSYLFLQTSGVADVYVTNSSSPISASIPPSSSPSSRSHTTGSPFCVSCCFLALLGFFSEFLFEGHWQEKLSGDYPEYSAAVCDLFPPPSDREDPSSQRPCCSPSCC